MSVSNVCDQVALIQSDNRTVQIAFSDDRHHEYIKVDVLGGIEPVEE
ncbi:hypothetical protein Dd703_2699 [Musicola paradisiaca Ech703]|uniref:Uncharacterized protein n=1 Tax=Musicola paradisiaca (strain Ech703) TaxID=579405 RepID=C6CAH8_MUSP7|nr:hypothetical protein Dd703_2699 [Musicola paradisiaca Ech703]